MPYGFQIGYSPDGTFTDALTMQLNLMVENEEAKIVANPQTIAQDGKKATLSVMKEEYFLISDNSSAGGVSFSTLSQLETVTSGTKLEITPYISDMNEIVLEVAVELSDSIPSGRESDLPVVTRRNTTNEVIIKDGGTVAIAGLQQHKTIDNNRRVPGLSRLPLIGKLFQHDNNTGESREIAVFITARLIPEHSLLNQGLQQTQGSQSAGQPALGMAPTMQPGYTAPYMAPSNQPANMGIPSNDFQAELMNQIRRPSGQ
jgi:type II secretory pathway component GspD/PulD (secretin)